MKKIIFALVIVLFTTEAFTQTNMVVRTKTGTYTAFSISDIDRIDFAPCGIIDYGGQTYYTVKIGDQCWFAQNLNIGTRIDGSENQSDDSNIEKYCYDDDPANCTTKGGLYQWNEAMQYVTTEGTQGICPSGWHIPTLAEFTTLKSEVSDDGNALKAIGQGTGSGVGTNTSGFSALLAGYRNNIGVFDDLGHHATFWSSTVYNSTEANNVFLYYTDSNIYLVHYSKAYGWSVRCLKD